MTRTGQAKKTTWWCVSAGNGPYTLHGRPVYGVFHTVAGTLLQILSPFTLLALSSLPLAWRSVRILSTHLYDPPGMAPANLATIQAHALSCTALIIAYLVQGI